MELSSVFLFVRKLWCVELVFLLAEPIFAVRMRRVKKEWQYALHTAYLEESCTELLWLLSVCLRVKIRVFCNNLGFLFPSHRDHANVPERLYSSYLYSGNNDTCAYEIMVDANSFLKIRRSTSAKRLVAPIRYIISIICECFLYH